MARTNVKVSEETWQELNAKKSPGDTFEDVIQRLLDDQGPDSAAEQPAES